MTLLEAMAHKHMRFLDLDTNECIPWVEISDSIGKSIAHGSFQYGHWFLIETGNACTKMTRPYTLEIFNPYRNRIEKVDHIELIDKDGVRKGITLSEVLECLEEISEIDRHLKIHDIRPYIGRDGY